MSDPSVPDNQPSPRPMDSTMDARDRGEEPSVPIGADVRPTDPSVMTVNEAAAALGIAREAVWGRIKRGTLPKVDGMVGPGGEVYVDISRMVDRRKRAAKESSVRPAVHAVSVPVADAGAAEIPSVPGDPSPVSVPSVPDVRPTVDDRDVEIAGLRAEITASHHQAAFLTDQLELRRLEVDRKDQVISELNATIAAQAATIGEQGAALGEAMATIRALQAATPAPMLLEAVSTGMPLERPLEARDATHPPSVTDETLKRGLSLAAMLSAFKFWEGKR